MLHCPNKTIFLADALGRLKKIVFLVSLGQYSTFREKYWFYWDSTALSASGLSKNAVLSQ